MQQWPCYLQRPWFMSHLQPKKFVSCNKVSLLTNWTRSMLSVMVLFYHSKQCPIKTIWKVCKCRLQLLKHYKKKNSKIWSRTSLIIMADNTLLSEAPLIKGYFDNISIEPKNYRLYRKGNSANFISYACRGKQFFKRFFTLAWNRIAVCVR